MFTALESEAFFFFFFYIQMLGWFTCEIKSQEKQIEHPLTQVKGERNAMFIVALYLVIKEHKICLRLFLCEHSLMTDHFFFSFLGPGVACTLLTCTHLLSPPTPALFFILFFLPSWPSFFLLNLHLLCLYFAPPACLCPVRFRRVYLLTSVPAECEHECERLPVFTNAGKLSKRLNSCTTLLPEQHRNTFQFLLQFCKKCVHLFLCITLSICIYRCVYMIAIYMYIYI